jgi:leucyl-tRNA synthetase
MGDEEWVKRWEEEKAFEANPGKGRKFYITAAFPYPNSPQHIGHGRTYTTADVYARYMRMKGYNVLFPMAFHVTGTPILAMAKRIKERDAELLNIFEKIYGIDRETTLSLDVPEKLVGYFSSEIETGMKEMGYSIDWRRRFYSSEPHFNRFIEWQFNKLKEKGYITSGEHPVPWCPSCKNPVSAHDTQGDKDPYLEQVVVILFKFMDGFLLTTTYRPETLYGVTNIWINPNAEHVLAKSDGRLFYLTKNAFDTLSHQMGMELVSTVENEKLLSSKAINPLTGEEVPIFPAEFVNPEVGTGIVMSVPAHAPFDYLALRDKGLDKQIPLLQVISVEGFGEFPAKEIVEKMGISSQTDPNAESATKALYRKEAHTGRMVAGKYKGEHVITAKEKIADDLARDGKAFFTHIIANPPIICRCGARCVVKTVKDQFFIDYGNAEWKEETKRCLESMRILPDKTRQDYSYTIDWLKEKACTRSKGLGTRFPFDKKQMIEALSDSTIYMAFYTISHLIRPIPPEKLTNEFFDYVFLGKGEGNEEMKKIRDEFLYWYPLDSRHSATDLIHNHLTFLIFNHVAIFPQELWPRQIVANGFVLMDGKKMSKSMGNILPIRKAIEEYGADAVRFVVVSGADLSQDSDFNRPAAEGVLSRLKYMKSLFEGALSKKDEGQLGRIDRWMLSRLHRRIKNAPSMYEDFQLRDLANEVFYNTINDISWYSKRTDNLKLKEFFSLWIPLIAPFFPFYCEECWGKLGGKGLVSLAQFPSADESKIDSDLEEGEELVMATKEDILSIMKIMKIEKPKEISLYVASPWKRKVYEIVSKEKNFEGSMKKAMENEEIKVHAKECTKLIQQYMKSINTLRENAAGEEDELEALLDAKFFFEREFGCPFFIAKEDEAKSEQKEKAKRALPMKVSIFIG